MKKIDFVHELSRLKPAVWHVLRTYLPKRHPTRHYEMVADYPRRQGKYLRPGLLLLAIDMWGGNKKLGLRAAAAMQASEEWLLVHDDIEDHSNYRRHKPTLNILHGDELAINAGDTLHIIMWKIIADSMRELPEKLGEKVFDMLNTILMRTTEGQYLELSWIRDNRVRVSEKEYFDMIKRKTAFYTIIGPLQLGAIIAGASEKDIKNIEKWGLYFGYAFQIWDDYMNICGSAMKQGKDVGSDIIEGKRTLILSHLLSLATSTERKQIEKIYRKNRSDKTSADKRYILDVIRKYGSDEYAKTQARAYGAKARKIFLRDTSHLKDTRARDIILAGIDFVTNRQS